MSDRLRPPDFETLARWVLGGLRRGEILELPQELWHEPRADDPLRSSYAFTGDVMATPFGVAAGPHTQLATGLVASWLCGARLLELKTVQKVAVDVVRPCIRMRDEGLNVEWSQELTPAASYEQYLDAWVLIHALHRLLGWPGTTPETVFDISVGYDLEGLRSPAMQEYLARVADAGEGLSRRLEILARLDARLEELEVPARLARSATISTLHGCPPEEIGGMARHLMEEHGLNVRVKLNPTLLGARAVREVLHERLGWHELVPDEKAFAHDLRLEGAVELIEEMQGAARAAGVHFGVKLSNTLPLVHGGEVFAASERTMYLSGRPLHALTVQTAARLDEAVGGGLSISFCGGADAFNLPDLVAAGLAPVTVCSDLLRPGGVGRMSQYGVVLREAMEESGANDLESFPLVRARQTGFAPAQDTSLPSRGIGNAEPLAAARHNLQGYAGQVLEDPRYRREPGAVAKGLKGTRPLGLFDCIQAPCTEDCGIDQKVPEYMRRVEAGDFIGAAKVVREDNALGASLGRACHHPCETRCTREAYEAPLAIRHIKRFALEAGEENAAVGTSATAIGSVENAGPERTAGATTTAADSTTARAAVSAAAGEGSASQTAVPPVAVVGAGPCGLAAALDLRRAGVAVTVLEARERGAGMVTDTLPAYRAPDEAAERDLQFLRQQGVEFRYGVRFGVDVDLPALRAEGFGAVVLAMGAQRGKRLGIPGEDLDGVLDGLELLRQARQGAFEARGKVLAVVGGGDVAVDCARTLRRLVPDATVEILYRRRIQDMPAAAEELRALNEEGIGIRELVVPVEAMGGEDGGRLEPERDTATQGAQGVEPQQEAPANNALASKKLTRVRCAVLRPGEPGADGRPRPEPTGETLELDVDLLVTAIGQQPADEGLAIEGLRRGNGGWVQADSLTGRTGVDGVWAGGDLVRGPSTLVTAAGDGRRIARDILAQYGVAVAENRVEVGGQEEEDRQARYRELMLRRARRVPPVPVRELEPSERRGFEEVLRPYTADEAQREAARCLQCDLLCSTCVTVCPNRAFMTLEVEPFSVRWAVGSRAGAPEREQDRAASSTVEFTLSQPFQTVVLNDLCNECGNCTEFCPTAGRPYQDKPRLTLDPQAFESIEHNIVLVQQGDEELTLRLRWHGQEHRMVWGETVSYEGPQVRAQLDVESGELIEVAGEPGSILADSDGADAARAVWEPCFVLFVLGKGLETSRHDSLKVTK